MGMNYLQLLTVLILTSLIGSRTLVRLIHLLSRVIYETAINKINFYFYEDAFI